MDAASRGTTGSAELDSRPEFVHDRPSTPLVAASCVIINKNEESVAQTLTLLRQEMDDVGGPIELIVVDASGGRLDDLYAGHDHAHVLPYTPPPGVAVSIPHQRNYGIAQASNDVIVFIDAGCQPERGWLAQLLAPLAEGEDVVAGRTVASPAGMNSYRARTETRGGRYLTECPTINLAFRRSAAVAVGGFDESFRYGSDVDFSWRLVDNGYRIRFATDAVVKTDWGTWRRQVRRSYLYGRARAHLYRKHRSRRSDAILKDPVVVVYPIFLLGLPLALRWPAYLGLLIIPWWRNRKIGGAGATVDHLVYGAGVLAEIGSWLHHSSPRDGPVE